MDWLWDRRRGEEPAVEAVADHLRRHAAEPDLVDDARRLVADALGPVDGSGTVWLHLDWTRPRPRLTVRPVDPGRLGRPLPTGDGAMPVGIEHQDLLSAAAAAGTTHELPVARRRPLQIDPDVGVLADLDLDPARHGAAAVGVALAAAAEAHPAGSPERIAAVAGAAISDSAVDPAATLDADGAADAFARLHGALGAEHHTLSVAQDRIDVTVKHCPFGDAVQKVPSLCRVSQSMVGRLAARVNGTATVVLDEAIAYGDPACLLRVHLGEPTEEVLGSTFHWPPTGNAGESEDDPPRLRLTVALPRESHSVPVVRRLAAQALRAFGVTDEDISDVELAITEACANVIDHAIDSDSYEVEVELAADRCAITVIDRGGGFDATMVGDQQDDAAEHGRGLTLMRALVDNVDFVDEPQVGAVVHMVKALSYDRAHPLHRSRTG